MLSFQCSIAENVKPPSFHSTCLLFALADHCVVLLPLRGKHADTDVSGEKLNLELHLITIKLGDIWPIVLSL